MKVGDKFWVFDENNRVYDKSKSFGGPIYIKHFVEVTIIDETSKSWIIDRQVWGKSVKIPKKDPKGLYTWEQVEEMAWAHENRSKIDRLIFSCSVEQLRDIAKILGVE